MYLPQGIARLATYAANDGQSDSYLRAGILETVIGLALLALLIIDAKTQRQDA